MEKGNSKHVGQHVRPKDPGKIASSSRRGIRSTTDHHGER
jgi:hypothetical protein